ncbi:ABC transporter substrate-binding protein [Saccharibacillus sacchari]|uniref:ABC transporter substrate-binding protein n=1 Tax=Saccharibacillus sacchari TaxID=456493 RepID=UPI000684E82D|nr:ABC transporter substrate-binding protein [Saccharibacillus sacchari]
MFKSNTLFRPLMLLSLLTVLLSGCAGTPAASNTEKATPQTSAQNQADIASNSPSEPSMRTYTDQAGREVEIPVTPERIVYIGSNPGDLLAIGVKPIGASLSVIASQVAYPDLLEGIEDVGYPYSLEKITALSPDLILFDDWNVEEFETLEKIAPTAVIGADDPIDMPERLKIVADLANQKEAAEKWMAAYEQKVETAKVALNLPDNPTASSLLLLGETMYIMGNQGFNQTLYGRLDLAPTDNVQKLIDQDERFIDVSNELVPDYVGTEIFLLTSTDTETVATQNALLNSSVWKTIPAVQQGRVHIMDSKWNFDDPVTSERLLDELVKTINGTN